MPGFEIAAALASIQQAGQEIRLFNIYQGIPISNTAEILDVQPSQIRVRTNKYQLACLFQERETFIQSNKLAGVVHARVASVFVKTGEAILLQFEFSSSPVGDRQNLRVWPKDTINSKILSRKINWPVRAELGDLSMDGLSFYFHPSYFSPEYFQKDDPVQITFRLPGRFETEPRKPGGTGALEHDPLARFDRNVLRTQRGTGLSQSGDWSDSGYTTGSVLNPEITLNGRIANINSESRERIRIGVRLNSDDPALFFVKQFLQSRQSEIIRELRAFSNLLENKDGS